MGFSNTFVEFIKILYQNNISFIANNSFLSTPIRLERGLRQGCLLSLPLYVIQGEVTTINIIIKTLKVLKRQIIIEK